MTIHPETIEVVLGSIMLVGSVGVGVLALLNEYGPWFLSPLLEWGKLRQEKTEYQRISSIFSGMLHMTVPKMWFLHFYLLGLATQVIIAAIAGIHVFKTLMILMSIQLLRRTYECIYVHRRSPSRMHVLHYATGISFYPMAVAVWLYSEEILPPPIPLQLKAFSAGFPVHIILPRS
eukprot:gene9596-1818_t